MLTIFLIDFFQGFVDFAFDPNFEDNHFFYVSYTINQGGDLSLLRRLHDVSGRAHCCRELISTRVSPSGKGCFSAISDTVYSLLSAASQQNLVRIFGIHLFFWREHERFRCACRKSPVRMHP